MTPGLNSLTLKTSLKALADFLMPRGCLACGRMLEPDEDDLCGECAADLPLTRYSRRERNPMADRFNARLQEHMDAAYADGKPPFEPYAAATALFFYSGMSPYSAIPRHLKYHRGQGTGRRFGARLGRELAASPVFADADLVVPVPLHPLRRWRRGYNQAEVLAAAVAGTLPQARLDATLLIRKRRTATQTRLSVEEKMKNVGGAFAVSARRMGKGLPECRHILLIDDVCTTASTLAACHAALREVFPPDVRISAATLCFTGEF